MNYASLDFTNYVAIAFSILGAVIVLGFILYGIDLSTGQHNEKDTKAPVGKVSLVIMGLMMAGSVACVVPMAAALSIKNNNNAAATQNIQEKYDVKSVDWSAKETQIRSNGAKEKEDSGEVLITLPNDEKQLYLYEVNKDTSEPTLKDSPLHGSVSAESLLKTSNLKEPIPCNTHH